MQAHRLARDPATVRRELRKLNLRKAGSVFCQHCGVDCLHLTASLKGLASEEDREKLRTGSTLGTRPGLDFIGKLVIGQPMEEHNFKARVRKNVDSQACAVQ